MREGAALPRVKCFIIAGNGIFKRADEGVKQNNRVGTERVR